MKKSNDIQTDDPVPELVRAAQAWAYDVGQRINEEDAVNAKALAMLLRRGAEFVVSVRLSPGQPHAVVAVVVDGQPRPYIVAEWDPRETATAAH